MDSKHQQRKELIDQFFQNISGYPNIEPQIVFDNLPNVWKLMDKNDILPGIDFNEFTNIVLNVYATAAQKHQMQNFMKAKPEFVESTVISSKIKGKE